jgi:nicotinamide N-methyltransferase
LWGRDAADLLDVNAKNRFDVLLLCDLVFNFSQHGALLDTVVATMAPDGTVHAL